MAKFAAKHGTDEGPSSAEPERSIWFKKTIPDTTTGGPMAILQLGLGASDAEMQEIYAKANQICQMHGVLNLQFYDGPKAKQPLARAYEEVINALRGVLLNAKLVPEEWLKAWVRILVRQEWNLAQAQPLGSESVVHETSITRPIVPLSEVCFQIAIFQDTRVPPKTALEFYMRDCIAPSNPSRDLSVMKNYLYSLFLDRLERELLSGRWGRDFAENPIDIRHGTVRYFHGDAIKPVGKQSQFEVALKRLLRDRDERDSGISLDFYMETPTEMRNRLNAERAATRSRSRSSIPSILRPGRGPTGRSRRIQHDTATASGDVHPPASQIGESSGTARGRPEQAQTRESERLASPKKYQPIVPPEVSPRGKGKTPAGVRLDTGVSRATDSPSMPSYFSAPSSAGSQGHGVVSKFVNRFQEAATFGKTEDEKSLPSSPLKKSKFSIMSPVAETFRRSLRNSLQIGKAKEENDPSGLDKYQRQDFSFKRLYAEVGTENYVRGAGADENNLPELLEEVQANYKDLDAKPVEADEEEDEDPLPQAEEFLVSELNRLQDREELTQIREGSQDKNFRRWQECCKMFQIDANKIGINETVKVHGLKTRLYQYQAFGVYWKMVTARESGGGFVGDEMGLGKTLTFLAYIVVERQLAWLWRDINESRKELNRRHFRLDQTDPDIHIVCPSEYERPDWIACPCIPSSPTAKMKPKPGVRLACVPAPLILTWKNQWHTHIDELNTDLGMRLAVAHPPSFPQEDRFDPYDARHAKNMQLLCAIRQKLDNRGRVLHDDISKSNQERVLLLTTTQVYRNWVVKTFEYDGQVLIRKNEPIWGKGKKPGIVFGVGMIDECHEQNIKGKRRGGVLADLPAANRPFLWGYSGTPLAQTPRALELVLWALEQHTMDPLQDKKCRQSAWEQDGTMRMQQFSHTLLDGICCDFERYIRKNFGYKDLMPDLAERLMPFLQTFMIRRTADTKWFGHPLIKINPHCHQDVTLKHYYPYQSPISTWLTQYEQLVAKDVEVKLLELQTKWDTAPEAVKPTAERPMQLSFNGCCRTEWRLRIIASFPYLAKTAMEHKLDFTAAECNRWRHPRDEKRSPYAKDLGKIVENSAKCLWLYHFIRDMQGRKDVDGNEHKLVIITSFNPVGIILKLFIEKYLPNTTNRVALIYPSLPQRTRTTLLEAFTDTIDPATKTRKQKDNYQFLIGPPRLIGQGLQLIRASNIILFEPDFDHARELQAVARVNRIGQRNEMSGSWRLVNDSSEIEKRIVWRQGERKEGFGMRIGGEDVLVRNLGERLGQTIVDEAQNVENETGPSGS